MFLMFTSLWRMFLIVDRSASLSGSSPLVCMGFISPWYLEQTLVVQSIGKLYLWCLPCLLRTLFRISEAYFIIYHEHAVTTAGINMQHKHDAVHIWKCVQPSNQQCTSCIFSIHYIVSEKISRWKIVFGTVLSIAQNSYKHAESSSMQYTASVHNCNIVIRQWAFRIYISKGGLLPPIGALTILTSWDFQ